MASHDPGADGSAEYPRIASRRKASLSTPTLDSPFSSSWIPSEVSESPVRLLTKRRVMNLSDQQQDEYSNPTNWSRVLSSAREYTQRPKRCQSCRTGHAAETSSKVDLLLESLETVVSERHKALVFSQWTSLLDLVEGPLAAAGMDHVRLDGSTVDRRGVVARFQDADGPPVMLVSLKAGGTGLNLTAADHVFLMDPWWNPAVEDQAADRTHRIGQDKPVFVYRLVAENTVEEKILALQESKRRLAEAALGEGAAAASLTRDDLLELLA